MANKAVKLINPNEPDTNIYVDSTGVIHNRNRLYDELNQIWVAVNNLKDRTASLEYTRYETGTPSNDLNYAVRDGCFCWVPETANRPAENYGVVFVANSFEPVHNFQSNWCNQLAFGTGGGMYFRQKINAGGWTNWQTIQKY